MREAIPPPLETSIDPCPLSSPHPPLSSPCRRLLLPRDDILAEPTEQLRRAIAHKAQRADTRLMTRFQNEMDDLRAAWPINGLARRFPAHDLTTLETLLKEYAHLLLGDLPHGGEFRGQFT
jgi:hypothetical protein